MHVSPQGFPSLQILQQPDGPVPPSPQAVTRGVELVSITTSRVGRNANRRRMVGSLSGESAQESARAAGVDMWGIGFRTLKTVLPEQQEAEPGAISGPPIREPFRILGYRLGNFAGDLRPAAVPA